MPSQPEVLQVLKVSDERWKNQCGFSLIEMLTVVAILSIMANAAMFRYVRSLDKRDKVQAEGMKLTSLFRASAAGGTAVGRNVNVDMRTTAVCSGGVATTPMVRAYADYNSNHLWDGTSSTDELIGEWTSPKYCDGTVGDKDVRIEYLRALPAAAWYGLPAGVTAQMVFVQRGDSWYNNNNSGSDPDYAFNIGGATKMSGEFMRITTQGITYPTSDKRAWVSFGICTFTGTIQVYNGWHAESTGGASQPCM